MNVNAQPDFMETLIRCANDAVVWNVSVNHRTSLWLATVSWLDARKVKNVRRAPNAFASLEVLVIVLVPKVIEHCPTDRAKTWMSVRKAKRADTVLNAITLRDHTSVLAHMDLVVMPTMEVACLPFPSADRTLIVSTTNIAKRMANVFALHHSS